MNHPILHGFIRFRQPRDGSWARQHQWRIGERNQFVDRSNAIRHNSAAMVVGYCINYSACHFEAAAADFQVAKELAHHWGEPLEMRFCSVPLGAMTLAMEDPNDPAIDPLLK